MRNRSLFSWLDKGNLIFEYQNFIIFSFFENSLIPQSLFKRLKGSCLGNKEADLSRDTVLLVKYKDIYCITFKNIDNTSIRVIYCTLQGHSLHDPFHKAASYTSPLIEYTVQALNYTV